MNCLVLSTLKESSYCRYFNVKRWSLSLSLCLSQGIDFLFCQMCLFILQQWIKNSFLMTSTVQCTVYILIVPTVYHSCINNMTDCIHCGLSKSTKNDVHLHNSLFVKWSFILPKVTHVWYESYVLYCNIHYSIFLKKQTKFCGSNNYNTQFLGSGMGYTLFAYS